MQSGCKCNFENVLCKYISKCILTETFDARIRCNFSFSRFDDYNTDKLIPLEIFSFSFERNCRELGSLSTKNI